MAIRALTNEQHKRVLGKLVDLARTIEGTTPGYHPAGPEYTSLMVCFLMHNLSVAQSLLKLLEAFSEEFFPTTMGFVAVRSMFEADVNAHYITLDPVERSRCFIEFEAILEKRQMDRWEKHRASSKPSWQEAMNTAWSSAWLPRKAEIERKCLAVQGRYQDTSSKAKVRIFANWSGKSLRELAVLVDHEEAYDVFYSDLSSFAHVDVRLANRFLRIKPEGLSWTQRALQPDVGGVIRYAAIFLDCFLRLFGREFGSWDESDVQQCWESV
jgi:hypothetical protein